jgi:hypothetical protein
MIRKLSSLSLLLLLSPTLLAQDPSPQAATEASDTLPADSPPPPGSGIPRWLDEVRAQRRALQELRRAEHDARRHAIDPLGAAQHDAREEAFLRRRQEIQSMMEQDRRLFLNQGPWLAPWPGPPLPSDAAAGPGAPPAPELPDWDNGWYYHGW